MKCCIALLLIVLATERTPAQETAPPGKYTAAERRHWAYQKRRAPEIPAFTTAADRVWVKTPVDAFILASLKRAGLRPAPEADRRTLIRRASFDLRGLPPSPEEIRAFVDDRSPDAWDKVVDGYLNSSHYGERWAQHWLDVVRYSETDGFEKDAHRNGAWRFREYVIRSLNEDKPYDRFVMEQLAGDELDSGSEWLRVASGLQRMGPLRKNGGNQDVADSRAEVLTEMTNIVGPAFLGMTIGCARCHDHKFDAIRQSDYFRIQAYFAATHEKDVSLASAADQAAWAEKTKQIEGEIKKIKSGMQGKIGDELTAFEKRLEDATNRLPPPPPALFSVENDFKRATPIHLLERGDPTRRKERVGARPLGVLLADDASERAALPENPRTKLAEWIVDPENPLTARVMANRVWYWHFGRGIVATPNDFGKMGARPKHPELLDWLSNQFVSGGWKLKAVHKLILSSSTWKQSYDSPSFADGMAHDPENRLLWHAQRRRLDAEELRDSMLTMAGRLNLRKGGEGVMVPVEKDLIGQLYYPNQWAVAGDKSEFDRRSVYLIAKRNLRLPMMETFDAPDLQTSCAKRESSTHAPQALELTNGDFANQMAEAFAQRLSSEARADPKRIVELAWELATGRAPNAKERTLSAEFLRGQRPLREFALAILNLSKFVYVE